MKITICRKEQENENFSSQNRRKQPKPVVIFQIEWPSFSVFFHPGTSYEGMPAAV